jgi:hypothetical protein
LRLYEHAPDALLPFAIYPPVLIFVKTIVCAVSYDFNGQDQGGSSSARRPNGSGRAVTRWGLENLGAARATVVGVGTVA